MPQIPSQITNCAQAVQTQFSPSQTKEIAGAMLDIATKITRFQTRAALIEAAKDYLTKSNMNPNELQNYYAQTMNTRKDNPTLTAFLNKQVQILNQIPPTVAK
jgi:hypothetical protein